MDGPNEILTKLQSADPQVAVIAVADLLLRTKTHGERPPWVLPELLRMAADQVSPVGILQTAVLALPTFAPTSDEAKRAILAALKDPHKFVRREALQALIGMKNLSDEDLDAIRAMRTDKDKHVAMWADTALHNIEADKRSKIQVGPLDKDPMAQWN